MTRDAVLAAARELLERDRGASLHDVATSAGVSRATVYRLFGSRDGLLQALDLEPGPDTRRRVLEAALELVDRDGLTRLSMDEVAAAAGVSRASLYRLFPGKAALFRELLVEYAPMEAIAATVEGMADRPPEEVMPAVASAAARTLRDRIGVVRTLLFEATSLAEDAGDAVRYVATRGVGTVVQYLSVQMAEGRLRSMHPMVAAQSFAGPILLHLLVRRAMERELGLELPLDETVADMAALWVRAMRIPPETPAEP